MADSQYQGPPGCARGDGWSLRAPWPFQGASWGPLLGLGALLDGGWPMGTLRRGRHTTWRQRSKLSEQVLGYSFQVVSTKRCHSQGCLGAAQGSSHLHPLSPSSTHLYSAPPSSTHLQPHLPTFTQLYPLLPLSSISTDFLPPTPTFPILNPLLSSPNHLHPLTTTSTDFPPPPPTFHQLHAHPPQM